MRHFFLFISLAVGYWLNPLYAQDAALPDTLYRKANVFEVGLNITSTISSFLGSGSIATNDPYIFSAKWIKGKQGIRTGFNLNFNDRTEISTDFLGQRDIKEINLKLRVGYERRIFISKHLDLFWGIDLVGLYGKTSVDFSSAIGLPPSFLENKAYSIGFGPALGIMFHINKRLALSTESTLHGIFTHTQEREYAPPITSATDSDQFNVTSTLPSSLYLIVKF